MKNDNITPENLSPEELMQGQLCAYIFEELPPEEIAHVEARIAESTTWRAEHDRLRGTIGLVGSTLKTKLVQSESELSAASLKALEAAANESAGGATGGQVLSMDKHTSKASPMRMFVPIAAGLAVTFGGVLAWKAMENGTLAPKDQMAQVEGSFEVMESSEPTKVSSLPGLKDESSLGWDANARAGKANSTGPEEAGTASEEKGGRAGFLASTSTLRGAKADRSTSAKNERFVKRAAGGGAPSEEVSYDSANPGQLDGAAQSGGVESPKKPYLRSFSAGGVSLGTLEEVTKSGGTQTRLGREELALEVSEYEARMHVIDPATDPNVYDIKRWSKVSERRPKASDPSGPSSPGPTTGGGYRGPSDSVPPGGPSTPDPAVPGTKKSAPVQAPAEKPTGTPDTGVFFDDGEVSSLGKRVDDLYQLDELAEEAEEDADGQSSAGDQPEGRFERKREAVARNKPSETPAQLELRLRSEMKARAEARSREILQGCLPKPQESPRDMYFRYWGDNPFVYTSSDKMATFAADVDTASYTLARNYLVKNMLPTKAQIRTEEFVNYFAGDIAPPTEEVFNVTTEAVQSPFGASANRYMLRVGLRGKVIAKENRPPMSLVFVVDTSGSMDNGNRMDLVKHSLRLLGTELDGRDQVGIVSFANSANLVLPMTSMDERGQLESAIQSLDPDGSTNVEDGMRLGYELLAHTPARQGELRRVVLISDGVANTGQTSADAILAQVNEHRENGIYLSTVGVGMGNHNDALLERLANRGNGICDYVDDEAAARRAMVDRFSGGFIPIARDLKIQVEFDGKYVLRYRQLGYENRAVADKDFRNDAVDGGEVGSGHQVTALFELDCVGLPEAEVRELLEMGKVRLRYKSVQTGSDEQVFETEHTIHGKSWNKTADAAQPGFQRAIVAAQFAEVLRKSTHAQADDWGHLVKEAARIADLQAFAGDAETKELRDMIDRAGTLGAGHKPRLTELEQTVEHLKQHRFLCGTQAQLQGDPTPERLQEIARLNAELEARIRELCLQEARSGK